MIQVAQTRFGRGRGNCLLACVASILHRPLESIPDFNLSGCGWFEDLYEWCLNEGLGVICIHPKDLEHSIFLNCWCIMIFRVNGFDDENHAVVGKCIREEVGTPDAKDAASWRWECKPMFDPNTKGGFTLGELEHLIFLIAGGQPHV